MQPARIKYSCKGRLDLTIPIYSVAFHCLSRVICWKHLIRGASHKHTEPDVLACLSAFRARLAIYWPFFKNSAAYATQYCIQLSISRKVVGKSTRDNPERYCGCFWVHCFSKKFQRMARESTDVCLRVLKESNKSRFDSYGVRKSALIISHITFRDCRVHSFSDNLSRNSCITKYVVHVVVQISL